MMEEKQKNEVGMEKDWESGLRFKKCCLYCILSNLCYLVILTDQMKCVVCVWKVKCWLLVSYLISTVVSTRLYQTRLDFIIIFLATFQKTFK